MRKLETTIDLLDALQERHGWESDRQIAIGLGVPTTTVSSWRRRAAYPTEVHAIKIAKALGMEPLHVLAIAAADRSPDEKTKKEWLAQIARFFLPLLVGTGLLTGTCVPTAQAEGAESVYYGKSATSICVRLNHPNPRLLRTSLPETLRRDLTATLIRPLLRAPTDCQPAAVGAHGRPPRHRPPLETCKLQASCERSRTSDH